jgi:hypothetical protein
MHLGPIAGTYGKTQEMSMNATIEAVAIAIIEVEAEVERVIICDT